MRPASEQQSSRGCLVQVHSPACGGSPQVLAGHRGADIENPGPRQHGALADWLKTKTIFSILKVKH